MKSIEQCFLEADRNTRLKRSPSGENKDGGENSLFEAHHAVKVPASILSDAEELFKALEVEFCAFVRRHEGNVRGYNKAYKLQSTQNNFSYMWPKLQELSTMVVDRCGLFEDFGDEDKPMTEGVEFVFFMRIKTQSDYSRESVEVRARVYDSYDGVFRFMTVCSFAYNLGSNEDSEVWGKRYNQFHQKKIAKGEGSF